MLEKPKPRKKRKIKTPIPSGSVKCAACDSTYSLEIHHVYFGNGGLRDLSTLAI